MLNVDMSELKQLLDQNALLFSELGQNQRRISSMILCAHRKQILDDHVYDFDFGIREMNTLKRMGVLQIKELVKKSEDDFPRYFSTAMKNRIKKALGEVGLSLGMTNEQVETWLEHGKTKL